jgi:peptidyl-tRNA hydrolase
MPFRKEERIEVDLALKTAADALERWVADGVEETMNLFNADAKKKKGS